MALRLQLFGASDIGQERKENQDRLLVRDDLQLAAVADGMGGMPCGAEAAQTAIEQLASRLAIAVPASLEAWSAVLDEVNRAVHTLGRKLSPMTGIGSTLTIAHTQGDRLLIAHVGDSAVFRWRDSRLEQLTREHTVAAEILERRAAGLFQPMPRGAEHTLSSCLGLPSLPQKDVHEVDLRVGDRLLLCSDGLTKPVDLETIGETLAQAASPEEAVAKLIAHANTVGGPDNITAIVGFAIEG